MARQSVTASTSSAQPNTLPGLVSTEFERSDAPAFGTEADFIGKIKPESLVPYYDGGGDPRRWLHEVKGAIAIGKWPEYYAVKVMMAKLTGAAKTYMERSVLVGQDIGYKLFSVLLESRFSTRTNLMTRLMDFKNARQERGETIVDFASRLRMLGFEACSSEDEVKSLGPRLQAYFLHGLRNGKIREAVMMQKPQSFEDTIAFAIEAEVEYGPRDYDHHRRYVNATPAPVDNSYQGNGHSNRRIPTSSENRQGRNMPSAQRETRNQRPAANATNRNHTNNRNSCNYCKKPGHHAGICRKRLFDENKCYECKQTGHMASECHQGRGNEAVNNANQEAHHSGNDQGLSYAVY